MEKTHIAVFDFDKTITVKDSFADLLFKQFKFKSIVYFTILSPILLLFLLKIIDRKTVKEKVFSMFFKGMSEKEFKDICEDYALKGIPNILRKEALEKIEWHKKNKHKIIIVSASVEEWIKQWAFKNGFENVISTKYEVKDGVLTGKFASENCYGMEKLNRFKEEYKDIDKYYIYMYGDSNGDKEMLEIAQEKFYRKFKKEH